MKTLLVMLSDAAIVATGVLVALLVMIVFMSSILGLVHWGFLLAGETGDMPTWLATYFNVATCTVLAYLVWKWYRNASIRANNIGG